MQLSGFIGQTLTFILSNDDEGDIEFLDPNGDLWVIRAIMYVHGHLENMFDAPIIEATEEESGENSANIIFQTVKGEVVFSCADAWPEFLFLRGR